MTLCLTGLGNDRIQVSASEQYRYCGSCEKTHLRSMSYLDNIGSYFQIMEDQEAIRGINRKKEFFKDGTELKE